MFVSRAHKRREGGGGGVEKERVTSGIRPVVQAKSLGRTQNSVAVQWFPVAVDVK